MVLVAVSISAWIRFVGPGTAPRLDLVTRQLTVTEGVESSPGWSPGGDRIAYSHNQDGAKDIFVHDLHTGTIERVSVSSDGTEGNNGSENPSISADGRFVAFESDATNLVAWDINDVTDIFVHQFVDIYVLATNSDTTEAGG